MTTETTITYLLTNSKDMTKFTKAMVALGCTVTVGENLHATVDYKFVYMANGVLSRRNIRTYGSKTN
jgi:hypothetical protein